MRCHRNWEIIIDTYYKEDDDGDKTYYTRFQALIHNPKSFRFAIHKRSWLYRINKAFGMQDVEVGTPEFDHDYVIKGNDPELLVRLFRQPHLQESIREIEHIYFSIIENDGWFRNRSRPEHVDTLYIKKTGIIQEKEILRNHYNLMVITLDQLEAIRAITNQSPGVSIYNKP